MEKIRRATKGSDCPEEVFNESEGRCTWENTMQPVTRVGDAAADMRWDAPATLCQLSVTRPLVQNEGRTSGCPRAQEDDRARNLQGRIQIAGRSPTEADDPGAYALVLKVWQVAEWA